MLVILLSGNAFGGGGYVIGLGAEGDTSDSLAFSLFGDFGLTEKTWLSVTAAKAEAQGVIGELHTLYGDIGLDHYFAPIGIRIGAAYWGDEDILDSVDVRGSIYLRTEAITFALDYERRNFDFLFQLAPTLERRQVEFEADGYGANFRAKAGKRVKLFIRGMSYEYSVDLTR